MCLLPGRKLTAGLKTPEAEVSSGALRVPTFHPHPPPRSQVSPGSAGAGMFLPDFSPSFCFPLAVSAPLHLSSPGKLSHPLPQGGTQRIVAPCLGVCLPSDPSSRVSCVTLSKVSDFSVPWLSRL